MASTQVTVRRLRAVDVDLHKSAAGWYVHLGQVQVKAVWPARVTDVPTLRDQAEAFRRLARHFAECAAVNEGHADEVEQAAAAAEAARRAS